jgi:hypothetical protein
MVSLGEYGTHFLQQPLVYPALPPSYPSSTGSPHAECGGDRRQEHEYETDSSGSSRSKAYEGTNNGRPKAEVEDNGGRTAGGGCSSARGATETTHPLSQSSAIIVQNSYAIMASPGIDSVNSNHRSPILSSYSKSPASGSHSKSPGSGSHSKSPGSGGHSKSPASGGHSKSPSPAIIRSRLSPKAATTRISDVLIGKLERALSRAGVCFRMIENTEHAVVYRV